MVTIGAAFNGGSLPVVGNHDAVSSLIMECLVTRAAGYCVVALVHAACHPSTAAESAE